jgi:hypothetical protein
MLRPPPGSTAADAGAVKHQRFFSVDSPALVDNFVETAEALPVIFSINGSDASLRSLTAQMTVTPAHGNIYRLDQEISANTLSSSIGGELFVGDALDIDALMYTSRMIPYMGHPSMLSHILLSQRTANLRQIAPSCGFLYLTSTILQH